MFKDRCFARVLDPSCGNGDLLSAAPYWEKRRYVMDGIEIDGSKHPTIKSKGINLVGLDFLRMESGAIYSHVIMNPPFAQGCEHVLKAWNMLFDGEIVAIINAETLRNAFSKERRHLVNLIEQHGRVQYVKDAFIGAGVQRQANVEIALVHLTKRADCGAIVGNLLSDLEQDKRGASVEDQAVTGGDLILPNNMIENTVIAFKAAVQSMTDAAQAKARANHYSAMLGKTMAQRMADSNSKAKPGDGVAGFVRATVAQQYDTLKDQAWAHILHSTQVTSKLSTSVQKRLESEFESIKKLEFSVANIHGFLAGLSSSGWEMQVEMMCEVFDAITRHHSENTVFYMGWKSNDRHRTCGMRVKMTRFIMPGTSTQPYETSLGYRGEQVLGDFDKVFAMLDGKASPANGLVNAFRTRFKCLKAGERVSSDYFDIRYYPGVGTIHLFARDKGLIDRLNRMVGQHRQWLPPVTEKASPGFWEQFDRAEKFDTEIRKAFQGGQSGWSAPQVSDLLNSNSPERNIPAQARMQAAIAEVLDRHGIDPGLSLENDAELPLLMIA